MMKSITNASIIALSFLCLISCNSNDDYIGPELTVADPNTFELIAPLQASEDSIDFANGTTYFKTLFNSRASWTLTLKGDESGAIKTFTGTSESIDSTLVTWDGGFDVNGKLKLFSNETVTASLSVFGIKEPYTYKMGIKNPLMPFALVNGFNNQSEQDLFFIAADSQDVNEVKLSNGTGDIFHVNYINNVGTVPEGSSYAQIDGQDLSFTKEYFTGNYGISKSRPFDTKQILTDPTIQLYFNFFLKGGGKTSTTKLEVQLEERYGDKWVKEVNTKFDGWKLISIPYTDFITSFGLDTDPRGKAGVHEANLIQSLSFLVSSVPSRNEVTVALDYPCFTINKPLFEIK